MLRTEVEINRKSAAVLFVGVRPSVVRAAVLGVGIDFDIAQGIEDAKTLAYRYHYGVIAGHSHEAVQKVVRELRRFHPSLVGLVLFKEPRHWVDQLDAGLYQYDYDSARSLMTELEYDSRAVPRSLWVLSEEDLKRQAVSRVLNGIYTDATVKNARNLRLLKRQFLRGNVRIDQIPDLIVLIAPDSGQADNAWLVTLAELSASFSETPIVVVSENTDPHMGTRCLRLGADEVFLMSAQTEDREGLKNTIQRSHERRLARRRRISLERFSPVTGLPNNRVFQRR